MPTLGYFLRLLLRNEVLYLIVVKQVLQIFSLTACVRLRVLVERVDKLGADIGHTQLVVDFLDAGGTALTQLFLAILHHFLHIQQVFQISLVLLG